MFGFSARKAKAIGSGPGADIVVVGCLVLAANAQVAPAACNRPNYGQRREWIVGRLKVIDRQAAPGLDFLCRWNADGSTIISKLECQSLIR